MLHDRDDSGPARARVAYYTFGLAAMWMAVLGIILLAIQMVRRAPVYYGDADWLCGDPALPPPGTPQIGRTRPAITGTQRRALPGSKK
jgi:hypothetical protein